MCRCVRAGAFVVAVLMALMGAPCRGQGTTEAQLRALLPDAKDLPGFAAVQPADELPPLIGVERHEKALSDWIRTDWDVTKKSGGARTGTIAVIQRTLYSSDGALSLALKVTVADTEANARAEYRETWGSGVPDPGSLLGPDPIGDESVAMPMPDGGILTCRLGRMVVHVEGVQSAAASRNHIDAKFPIGAVEAIAHSVLAHAASSLPEAVAAAGSPVVAVNGGLDERIRGILSAKRAYVPVVAVAGAAGWRPSWDAKAGALILTRSGKGTVRLQLFRDPVKVGATGQAKLLVPPFLLHGQPVMDLGELVGLLGGKVVEKTAERVSVQI